MLFHEWDNMVDVERSTNKIMASNFDKSNIKEFLKVYKKESQKGCLGSKQGFLLWFSGANDITKLNFVNNPWHLGRFWEHCLMSLPLTMQWWLLNTTFSPRKMIMMVEIWAIFDARTYFLELPTTSGELGEGLRDKQAPYNVQFRLN